MWLWIITGVVTYLALLLMIAAVAGSARKADRRERIIFARWVREREKGRTRVPALRSGHPQAA
jgi:hypothetical protein